MNGLARSLSRRRAQGTHVAVMLPNVAAIPFTWLALARIGAVMVPVNVGYTRARARLRAGRRRREFAIVDRHACPRAGGLTRCGLLRGRTRWCVAGDAAGRIAIGNRCAAADDAFSPPRRSRWTTCEHPVHLGHDRLSQGLHADAALLADERQGQRLPRRPHYERILASTPFYYMDPQWLLLMTFYQRGTLFVAARQSPSRFMGWVREHRIHFCLLP